ncbi:MAG: hypothetical protein AAB091_02695 [Elusimicrobiota bacterium]
MEKTENRGRKTNFFLFLGSLTLIGLRPDVVALDESAPIAAQNPPQVTVPQEKDIMPAGASPQESPAGATAVGAPANGSLELWVENQGGKIGTDKSKAATPALDLLDAMQAEASPQEEAEYHGDADPAIHALEELIEDSIPGLNDRGTRKERRFFKEHKLELEIDRMSKDKLLRSPQPDQNKKNGPEKQGQKL